MICRLFILSFAVVCCGPPRPPPSIFDCTKENCDDCAVLATKLSWTKAQQDHCEACQGLMASGAPRECENVPESAGRLVIRGCNTDTDCPPLSSFCGHYASLHFTCVKSDPK